MIDENMKLDASILNQTPDSVFSAAYPPNIQNDLSSLHIKSLKEYPIVSSSTLSQEWLNHSQDLEKCKQYFLGVPCILDVIELGEATLSINYHQDIAEKTCFNPELLIKNARERWGVSVTFNPIFDS